MRRFIRFLWRLWRASLTAVDCPTCNDHHWLLWTVVDRTGNDQAEISSCPDCNPKGTCKPCYKGVGSGPGREVAGLHHVTNAVTGRKIGKESQCDEPQSP